MPGATPETTATDQAIQQYASARDSLASIQTLARQGQNFAQAELQDGYLQRNVETARDAVREALGDEIGALMAADPALDQAGALSAVLMRHAGDPALQSELRTLGEAALANDAADATLFDLPNSGDPTADLYALDEALAGMPQDVRDAVLADPRAMALLDRAALAATGPIQPYLQPSDQRSGTLGEDIRMALVGLEQASAGLGPDLSGALVNRGLLYFEQLQHDEMGGADIIFGNINSGDHHGNALVQLVRLASHVNDAPGGQQIVDRLINLNSDGGGWEYALDAIDSGAGVDPLLANPVGPALFVALERRGIPLAASGESAALYATSPIQAAIDGPIQGNAEDYFKLIETMQFAAQMRPLFGSDAEYNAALDQLMTQKLGADWQQQIEQQGKVLANDGSLLLAQLSQYTSLPADSSMRPEIDRFIQDTLSDPAAQAAISLALRNDPALAQGARGEQLLDLFSTPGLDEGARGLAAEFGNLYVSTNTGAAIASIDARDPSSVAAAQAQVGALDDPRLATALGVPPGSLTSAVASLQQSLPGLASTDPSELQAVATSLNSSLNGVPGFSTDDPAGQIFRGIAATAAGSGQANALGVPLDDPHVESALQVVMDYADFLKGGNFTAKMVISLAVNEGLIPAAGMIGRYSALAPTLGGRLFAAVGIAGDLWNAYKSFDDGNIANGSLHLTAAGGALVGLLGTGTWAGPVGWAVAAISYVGLGAIARAEHNNRFETGDMKRFLAASGLSDTAAAELFNTTGSAVSPVPYLLHYAEQQGLSVEQSIAWLNRLAENNDLNFVVDLAHRAIDHSNSDGTGLSATGDGDAELQEQLSLPGANILGIALSHAPTSLTQMNSILEAAEIETPG